MAILREDCASRGRCRRRGSPRLAARRCPRAAPSRSADYVAAGKAALGCVPDAAPRGPRALLRRERRHAARRPRPVRLAHQPGLGPRPAQEVLRGLRLRAPGGRQRGGDRAEPRAAAQLRARGGLRVPPSRERARGARAGRPRLAALRDALALERPARASSSTGYRGGRESRRRSCACAPTTRSRRRSRRSSPAPRRCRAGRSPCRWITRSWRRRSRTA